jgi:hypothetical protein
MAIIRTQLVGSERRIITKVVNNQRRVSCSCCPSEEECCMYPADQFGTIDDLPDSVLAPINADQLGIYTRDGSRFVGTFTGDDGPIGFEVIVATSSFGATGWTLRAEGGTVTEGTFPCLFGQDELQTQDNFADTYTVTFPRLDGYGSGTATVTRQSLCGWSGLDETGCEVILIYETTPFPPLPNSRFKWVVETPYYPFEVQGGCETVFSTKTPNQNTPVGEYSGSFIGVVTVS